MDGHGCGKTGGTSGGNPCSRRGKRTGIKRSGHIHSVTSSYFFRGANLHSAATKDDKGNDEAFPMAPALQSGITVYAPIDGVFLDIWTSMALTERETEKYNGYFQLNLPLAYKVESVTVTFTAFGLYLLNNQAETLPDVYGGVSLGATYSL